VHSWIYGLRDGLLRDLGVTVNCPEDLGPKLRRSLERYQE
jgi:carbonic anhydrase